MKVSPGKFGLCMDKHLALVLPMHLIQAIRLAHVLMESDAIIHLSNRDAEKFEYLRQFFPLRFAVGEEGLPLAAGIWMSHAEPRTRIGTIERRLIFPRAVVERCRAAWQAARPRQFSFCGLMDRKRRAVLQSWVQSQHDARFDLVESERGREFPEKCWDQSYYDHLAQSQFVLCPAGDYVWSYRFFEAILCGAIPIAEQECTAFTGFDYRLMSDDAGSFEWRGETAERNYAHALRCLTVGADDLNAEVSSGAIFDPTGNDWHRMRETLREIAESLAPAQNIILIDQNAWSTDEMRLERPLWPFLDQGPPADDGSAITELQRLRGDGAVTLLVAAPCFWWLDHYHGFAAYLSETGRCSLRNDLVMVFELE